METVTDFFFLGSQITADDDCSHKLKRLLLLGRKTMTNLDNVLKSKDIALSIKVYTVKTMVFPEVMYGCESWTIRRLSAEELILLSLMLEKTLESPLDSKEIKQVNPKGTQPWIFIARTDVEAPVLWPPDAKSQLIGSNPDTGKDWEQEEKGATEDEMVGWHHWLNGHELSKLQKIVKDRKAWCVAVQGVTKSQTCLSD